MEDNQENMVRDQNAVAERQLTKTTTYVVGVLGLFFIPMACFIVTGIIVQEQVRKLFPPVNCKISRACAFVSFRPQGLI